MVSGASRLAGGLLSQMHEQKLLGCLLPGIIAGRRVAQGNLGLSKKLQCLLRT